jgi:predicted Zn finger-like uncharacterized protein
MIVRCEQCQVRFKVPDEKVTSEGVRVRCARCSHTFRIARGPTGEAVVLQPAPAEAPLSAPAGPDPFAHFGTPQPAELPDNPTRPGHFALGIAATKLNSMVRASLNTTPSPEPAPPPAPRPPPPAAENPFVFDFGGLTANGPAENVSAESHLDAVTAPLKSIDIHISEPSPTVDQVASAHDEATSFFEELPAPPTSAPKSKTTYTQRTNLREELFDMSFAAKPEVLPPADDFIDISTSEAPPSSTTSPKPFMGSDSMPALTPLPQAPPETRPWVALLTKAGVTFTLVSVLVLLASVFANDGAFDSKVFSPERLKALFLSSGELKTRDISNGLYETRAGRPIFFVRGEVENAGQSPSLVSIKAEILDGEQVVRTSTGVAFGVPTAEELHDIASDDDFKKSSQLAAQRIRPLNPGERAPFLVTFREYPPDLRAFRVRVSTGKLTSATASP